MAGGSAGQSDHVETAENLTSEREWADRLIAFLGTLTAGPQSQGASDTSSQGLDRCAARYATDVGAPPAGPLEPVHALAREMAERFEAEAKGGVKRGEGGATLIPRVQEAFASAARAIWGVSFHSVARMSGPGLGRGTPLGELRLEHGRLTFTTQAGDGFDVPVNDVRNLRTPWWTLGTGFRFRLGPATYACTFNQMTGNARGPKQMTQEWKQALKRAMEDDAARRGDLTVWFTSARPELEGS